MNRLTAFVGLVVVVTLVVYGSRLPKEFAGWDFEAYRGVIFSTDPTTMIGRLAMDVEGRIVPGYYAPVSSISLMMDKYLTGSAVPSPATTAFVNLVVHCVNGILLVVLLKALGAAPAFCGIAVFVFLLHPVQVESVIWFAQRKTVLGAMFCLLSWIAFRSFRRTGSLPRYVFSLLAFALGMLSKPTYVCLPALLLATEVLLPGERSLGGNRVGETEESISAQMINNSKIVRLLMHLLPFGVLSIGMVVLALLTEPTSAIILPWYQRPFIAAAAIWFYLSKLLLPVHLTVVYPRWQIDVSSWVWWIPLTGLVASGVILWLCRNRVGWRAFWAMSIFLIPLIPAIGFFKFGHQKHSLVSNQFLYFSMIGAACLPAMAVERFLPRMSAPLKYGFIAAGFVLCAFLIFRTENRAAAWNDTYTLWSENSRLNPTYVGAPLHIGVWLLERGNLQEAEEYFRKALELDPKNALAYSNLGLISRKHGNNEEAERYFRRALAEDPRLTVAVNNLARVLDARGRLPEAVDLYRAAISQKPDFPPVLFNLADALVRLNRIDEAIAVYTRLVRIGSGSASVHNMLGVLYMRRADREQGIRQFREALRIDPSHREARMNLEHALREMPEARETKEQ